MLVDSRSGKSGCSFEVVLENPESEFVMVTNDGKLVAPSVVPRRIKEACKVYPSETDVVKKMWDAGARRESELNRVRYAAHKHNVKVVKTLKEQQRQHAELYWQLDTKLRAADRRREDLVAQIRAKAQEHCAHVEAVSRTNESRSRDLEMAITECLVRAADNRARGLQETQARIASQNERKAHSRRALEADTSKAQMQAYWSLDRKMQEANRRRKANLNDVRERAASPSDKVAVIRNHLEKDAEAKADRLSRKLDVAAARKQENVDRVKARAQEKNQKVETVSLELTRKVTHLDISSTTKLLKAAENRINVLDHIRRQQKARELKAERVRMAKRAMKAQK